MNQQPALPYRSSIVGHVLRAQDWTWAHTEHLRADIYLSDFGSRELSTLSDGADCQLPDHNREKLPFIHWARHSSASSDIPERMEWPVSPMAEWVAAPSAVPNSTRGVNLVRLEEWPRVFSGCSRASRI